MESLWPTLAGLFLQQIFTSMHYLSNIRICSCWLTSKWMLKTEVRSIHFKNIRRKASDFSNNCIACDKMSYEKRFLQN